MSNYDNTDSGALFKNDDKVADDNRPNYTGRINVGGVDKRLAAWVKKDRNGKSYMSLKVSDPLQAQTPVGETMSTPLPPPQATPEPRGGGDPEDIIPF